jgi:hypothetical protein
MEKPSKGVIVKCRHCGEPTLFWKKDIEKLYAMVHRQKQGERNGLIHHRHRKDPAGGG